MTSFSAALNYYNAEASLWEPFIETFKVNFTLMKDHLTKKQMLSCECLTPISVNVTKKLVQNLSETYKSWLQISDEVEENDKNNKEDASYTFSL